MTYTFNIYKTMELDNVRYYFSKKAWKEFLKETAEDGLDRNDYTVVLMYCNTFEVM